jgi:phosphoribosylformylglycinamidine synthase
MSARGGVGMKIDLGAVPLRQQNMEPWEILLSESQERMLVVVEKGKEKMVEKIFDKWDLNCRIIGEVIDEDRLLFYMGKKLVADVPASSLVLGGGAPVYDREYREPSWYRELQLFNIDDIPEPENLKEIACTLIRHPNIASKRWVYEQYDTMVRTNNISTNFPSDAGVVNVKGTNTALAFTTDCNSRYVYADPRIGTMIAVSEAARNIICSGADPVAITNCLNFGNPYNPEVYWQFVEAVTGMGEACRKFDTPVTGGNVSFYNHASIGDTTEAIYPTPVIGMLGVIRDKNHMMTISFMEKGDMIYLVGESRNDIASSQYLHTIHGIGKCPPPYFNLEEEFKVQQAVKGLIARNLIRSAHDVSDGGLFISLVECSIPNDLGFDITSPAEIRKDAFLFGESQSRILVSVTSNRETDFIDFLMEREVRFTALGHVTKGELRIDDLSFGFISDIKKTYLAALENILKE